MIDHARRLLDWEYMVQAIERATPIHPPGRCTGYHGITFGFLVGEIVRRVSGMSFSEAVQDAIARPLGVRGLHIGAPPEVLPRAAELIWRRPPLQPPRVMIGGGERVGDLVAGAARFYEKLWKAVGIDLDLTSLLDALAPRGINSLDFNADETLRAAIPAVNGLFSARSLARMYAALAGDGEIDGVQLLSHGTLLRATERQKRAGRLHVIPFDMRWRLGYHGVATTRGVPQHGFGHFGFGGSGAWADPSRKLAVALIVNSGMGTPFGDLRIARIGGAVLDSLRG
jgi:CubicO group peptidase (beta-lactamase class C family)